MKYFNYEEFDSPDIQGSGQLMDEKMLSMLDEVREIYGKPISINSGYRTIRHNASVGGKAKSSHLKGLAVDIACSTSRDRYNLLEALKCVGFNRIGIAKSFIHIDIDSDKSSDVIWVY